VRALLRSAEDLRKAQQRALGGKGAQDLAKRVEDQRHAVRALARLGREILQSEGRAVSDAIVDRIAKTLEAAALDDGSRFLLRAGRLTDELEPPGFDALAGMATAAATTKRGPAKSVTKRERVADARRRLQEARQEARATSRAATDAEREAEQADSAAAAARREAEAARERADEAEQAVADAERALGDAQRD
jgi:hypothetical protein